MKYHVRWDAPSYPIEWITGLPGYRAIDYRVIDYRVIACALLGACVRHVADVGCAWRCPGCRWAGRCWR
eukprot:COSAG01_NODE_1418_length_10375_cov_38.842254_6_plen_69_part_00